MAAADDGIYLWGYVGTFGEGGLNLEQRPFRVTYGDDGQAVAHDMRAEMQNLKDAVTAAIAAHPDF